MRQPQGTLERQRCRLGFQSPPKMGRRKAPLEPSGIFCERRSGRSSVLWRQAPVGLRSMAAITFRTCRQRSTEGRTRLALKA